MNPFRVVAAPICWIKGKLATRHISKREKRGRVEFSNPLSALSIRKSDGAKLTVLGVLRVSGFLGDTSKSSLVLGRDSHLTIQGDFSIGPGVIISIASGCHLTIGGCFREKTSGITAHTTIMLQNSSTIGRDFLCAANVFITDSDWHGIGNTPTSVPVAIGNHVWIAHGAKVLKGARIGEGSVVSAGAIVTWGSYPDNVLLAGIPARIVREDIKWNLEPNSISHNVSQESITEAK